MVFYLSSLVLFAIYTICSCQDEEGLGYTIAGSVRLKLMLPNGTSYGAELPNQQKKQEYKKMTLVLSGQNGEITQFVQKDGKFKFSNVEPGPYYLQAHSSTFHFLALRVDVSKKQNGKVTAKFATSGQAVAYPLVLQPIQPVTYFEPRKTFSLLDLLMQNKLIWVLGFFMLMMGGMQKITSDPEIMKELRGDNQKVTPQDLLRAFLPKQN